ncbi:MAG: transglutaminase-like domain-containing protein [Desulfuromonadaceae bacterium]|nr:transglutaminase-like domain-containing protein [Desulfuromonadaceae bacterium]
MRLYIRILILFSLFLLIGAASFAASPRVIDRPPLSERWFGIYLDNERVGFSRQKISETAEGYLISGDNSVSAKIMGYTKEISRRESYLVSKNLSLRSFDIEQSINGLSSRVSGKVSDGNLRLKNETNGKSSDKQLRFRGEIFPEPVLNIYPLMLDSSAGKAYRILTFDPEELKIKEVTISVLGEGKTPEGISALKLRNTLYPFVTNDVWVDNQGNTLMESVRDGLVTTKVEDPGVLGAFVGSVALSKKDLIYDFSMIRIEPPIKEPKKLVGLEVEITGWNEAIPLLQGGGQTAEKLGKERVAIRTGSLVQQTETPESGNPAEKYLKPADKIESDAPEITAQVKGIAAGAKSREELAGALAFWTADWLKDTVADGGSALASLKSRTGNCQSHARLYTALARAAGIPTRFVSGLVYLEGKGFLYHSWAESFLNDRWVSIDPTYNQLPSDPTHLKLLEGHLPEDMAPIVAIIGRIKIKVLEAKY